MKKRLFACFLSIVMCLSLLPTTAFAADPTDYWTDAENVGTLPDPVDNVYTITSAAELAAVAKAVNEQTNDFSGKTILLAGDIDLSAHLWVPIGSSSAPFRGSLNGAGHAITGLTIRTDAYAYVGLFGYVCGGTYSNVTVTGSVSVEQNDYYFYVGGLIGCIYSSSSDSTKLSNVTTDVDISGKCYYRGYFGGMAGYCEYCEFENCTASGTVSGTITGDYELYLGGLTGYCRNCDFEKCAASGTISGTVPDGDDCFVGGLIGYADKYKADTALKNSYATGSVMGTASGYSEVYVGGLVGYNDNVPVKNCYAVGAVNASSVGSDVYVGGLAGYNSGAVDGCYATGTVTGRSDYPDTVYAGGLVGLNYAAVNHSYATGDVTATKGDPVYCGGFVGDNWSAIYNSYAAGSVNATSGYSGDDAVGGSFAGRNNKEIINCCALGNVTVKGNDQTIGGVFLGIANVNSSVRNCYAVGSVTSSATSGTTVTNGFAGVVKTASYASESDDGEISHCIYRENGITAANGETKTESVMKSTAFADELNEWINTYDGLETPLSFWKQSGTDYPVFDEDASPAVSYDIWLGGVRITSINCDDITAAINMKTPGAASGSAVYTPASGDSPAVLTLNGFHFSGEGHHISWKDSYRTADVYYGLCTKSDLVVILSGDNSITETSAGPANGLISCGISNVTEPSGYIYGDITLTFSGSGSLTAAGANSNVSKYDRSTGSYGIDIRGYIVLKDTVSVTGIGGDVSSKAEGDPPGWTYEKDIDTCGIRASSVSVPDGTVCKGIGGDVSLLDDLAETAGNYQLYGSSTGIRAQFGTMAGILCGIGGDITLNDTKSRSDLSRTLSGTSCGLRVNFSNNFTGSVSAAGGSITLEGYAADNPGDSASSSGFDQQTYMGSSSTFSGPLTICGNTAAIMKDYRNISASGFYDILADYSNTQLLANTENSAEGAAASPLTTGSFPTGDGDNVYKYISIAPLYTVTVEDDGNGTAEADITSAAEGETVTLTATPDDGYRFKEWQSDEVTVADDDTFTMPDEDVTVTAVFEVDAPASYTITVENDGNGSASADKSEAAEGETVTLTATPNDGYHFKEWQSSDVTVSNNSFTMPAEDVSVTAVFEVNPPETYTVTVQNDGNGTVSADKASAAAGETITLTATPSDGYRFKEWQSSDVTVSNNSFTMPAKNVTVKAVFEVDTPAAYTVTFNMNGHGTQVEPQTVAEGGKASIPTDPTAAGYTFGGWYADSAFSVRFDFNAAISADTTVYAKWTKNSSGGSSGGGGSSTPAVQEPVVPEKAVQNPFVDVSADAFYYDAVLWAAENEITGGTDAEHFSPNVGCTRAQVVTFLWRAAGCPEVESGESMDDVAAGSYYEKAVAWAIAAGITKGTAEGVFSPNAICSRAQIGTFLWRAAGSPILANMTANGPAAGSNPFGDVSADNYYYNAVLWAVTNGITNGTTADTFSPGADCTRAQIVTFLYRYMGK